MFIYRFVLALYRIATWLAQPLLRDKLVRRARKEPGYAVAVEERFGIYSTASNAAPHEGGSEAQQQPPAAPRIWLHAVSLGETKAAAVLLPELRAAFPHMKLILTHGTATGREAGAALLQAGDEQLWLPWDTRQAVQRFFAHTRPDLGLLMETEIWPSLLHEAAACGVPVALVNARLSERSLRGARRGAWLLRPAYASLAAAWAQTEEDALRLRRAGAPMPAVLGNLKFDARPNPDALELGRAWRSVTARPVLMLASSREGEEAAFLDAITALGTKNRAGSAAGGGVQWLIVPRHPQRFDEVEQLLRAHSLTVSRRSTWGSGAPLPADVWLGDSLGEMTAYYTLASVALLGGSFAPLGGQNLIEAAACACPVLMGPYTHNFQRACELALAAGAAARVGSMHAGCAAALDVLGNATTLGAMREAALRFASEHRGAARRTAGAVRRLLQAHGKTYESDYDSSFEHSSIFGPPSMFMNTAR